MSVDKVEHNSIEIMQQKERYNSISKFSKGMPKTIK